MVQDCVGCRSGCGRSDGANGVSHAVSLPFSLTASATPAASAAGAVAATGVKGGGVKVADCATLKLSSSTIRVTTTAVDHTGTARLTAAVS